MDKETRNAIERATQRARALLEDDFSAQIEGQYDILKSGNVASKGGTHLTSQQQLLREKIVASIEHKRAAGMKSTDAMDDYIRDASFTFLNRFVALKMLEVRELVQECISRGEQSSGYREFCGLAPGVALLPESTGYRRYIESVFDELSTEVKVLFDRRDPASVLWPKRQTFESLLAILNAPELAPVWGEDETIGWVYQYFNSGEERRAMRDASQVPRNSRELAVRNQFFTPRYVVQFLTDNTLGRIWHEMRQGNTRLVQTCQYLVLYLDESYPKRAKKDPRDIHILDPACGSGHFLLYAFDLLIHIYEEAWSDPYSPKSEATGRTLHDDYPDIEVLRHELPLLVLSQNLHGVDIDPRCAQIAQLALWMRAQRAYREFGFMRAERPVINRVNIIIAEPMPGEEDLIHDFAACLKEDMVREVFLKIVDVLKLAGELGLLLRLESLLQGSQRGQKTFFNPAEEKIRFALQSFLEEAGVEGRIRRRLFVGDAAQGLGLIELAGKQFDVVLMNPPFGELSTQGSIYANRNYMFCNNILATFLVRAAELQHNGLVGCVIDRTVLIKNSYEGLRRSYFLGHQTLDIGAELGWGVLDANVEVAAVCLSSSHRNSALGVSVLRETNKAEALHLQLSTPIEISISDILSRPFASISFDVPDYVSRLLKWDLRIKNLGSFHNGHTIKSDVFKRLSWEIGKDSSSKQWSRMWNGSEYSPFHVSQQEIVLLCGLEDHSSTISRNPDKHKKPGLCFGKRGKYLDVQILPAGLILTNEGFGGPFSDNKDSWFMLGWLNSRAIQHTINQYCGQHKGVGYVNELPVPEQNSQWREKIAIAARTLYIKLREIHRILETDPEFVSPIYPAIELRNVSDWPVWFEEQKREIHLLADSIDNMVNECIRLTQLDIQELMDATRDRPNILPFWFIDEAGQRPGVYASMLISYSIGVAFGRWDVRFANGDRDWPDLELPFGALPTFEPGTLLCSNQLPIKVPPSGYEVNFSSDGVLVDDLNHPCDIMNYLNKIFPLIFCNHADENIESMIRFLEPQYHDIRSWIRGSFFETHLRLYNKGRRKAPIYWQLSTPSMSYSVWLYIHAFTKDTLYKVQNDYVAPKLAHEERKLESMSQEFGASPRANERKQLAMQESFVEELRVFLDEVKRIAPLWNPKLDDGVVINFAPLWRLVPQLKPWQKELKATWEALCAGEYDWAHLAMHLWPGRVIPKCASDRSLAIAHNLEDVFWVEGDNGKWLSRTTPKRPVVKLVDERTSPAVKSALQSLLEAPVVFTGRGRRISSKGVNK